jgi:transposase
MLSLGIDCGQLQHRYCLLDETGRVLAEGKLVETHTDLAAMRTRIAAIGQPDITVMEASGVYWHNLHAELAGWGWQPVGVDPQRASQFARLLHPRHKTDKADARSLAHMGFSAPQESFRAQQPALVARCLVAAVEERSVLSNQLHALLVVANPAVIRCSWKLAAPRTLEMLAKYPTTEQLRRARTLADLRYAAHNRVGAKAATALQQASQEALCAALTPAHGEQIGFLVAQIRTWSARIDALEDLLATLLPEASRLLTRRGIGRRTALLLCALIPFAALASAKAVAAFVGLHPHIFQSGQGCWSRLSKRGDAVARTVLYRAALPAIQFDPDCAAFYKRLTTRTEPGQHPLTKKQACCAVAHKIARIAFAIMNNRTPHPSLKSAAAAA